MANDLETLRYSDYVRYRRILQLATQALLSHGYAGTCVEDIANDANVSKVTVYRLFEDKLGLAADVLRDLSNSLEMHFRDTLDMSLPLEECLVQFGVTYVRWMIQNIGTTHRYGITRLLIEMAGSHSELASIWTETHNKVVFYPLSQYFAKRAEAGELSKEEDPLFVAIQFILGFINIPTLILVKEGQIIGYDVAQIQPLVKRKVRLFLRGCLS